MYKTSIKLFLLSLIASCIAIPATIYGAVLPPHLSQEISHGDIKSAIESCSKILYTTGDKSEVAKVNAIMSILLLLDMNPAAQTRLTILPAFMLDNQNPDEKSAKVVINYLGKQFSGTKLLEQMKSADPNWQATALAARYIRILNELGVKPKLLNQCILQYMKISDQLQPNDWGNIWKKRMVLWHNSLQKKDSNISELEPLIAKAKKEALNGPLREQLSKINTILTYLLQKNKPLAVKTAKKALYTLGTAKNSTENAPYAALLNYLAGSSITPKELFKSTIQHPEFFLMTTIAVPVKKMSDAHPGNISKTELTTYLDNYTKNIGNTEQELVLKWEPLVKKWKAWCSAGFPYSASLKPLTAMHSKALAAKQREQAVLKKSLELYDKLSGNTSLRNVSLNDYKTMRLIFKNRPHPPSMEFTSSEVKGYVASLPVEVQRGEWNRIRYMNAFKKNMMENLNFSQYSGPVKLKTRTVKGKILKADSSAITIKTSFGTKKYKWGDIKPEQYIVFALNNIKNTSSKVRGRENMFTTDTVNAKEQANAYRLLSVFCDWYGKYPEALNYGKKADSYPYSKDITCKLLLQ